MLDLDLIESPADFFYLPETKSTMIIAAEYAHDDAPHLTAVFAETQTQGRGRRGKMWQNFTGCNVALTIILREVAGTQLPLVVSVALQKALAEFAPVKIKWPNDILAQNKKLAGILIEKQGDCHLLGIGINVTTPHKEILDTLPKDTFNNLGAIWLEEIAPKKVSREAVINTVFKHLRTTLATYKTKGWQGLEVEYKSNCITLNQAVTWVTEAEKISGTAIALTKSGALKLKASDGKMHTINAGDVVINTAK